MNTDPLEKVRKALEQGSLIEAIRAYREATGAGLADARDAVQRLMQQPPPEAGASAAPADAFEAETIESLERRIVRPSISGGLAALIAFLVAAALVLLLLIVMQAAPGPAPR
jgi:hypothetical protein